MQLLSSMHISGLGLSRSSHDVHDIVLWSLRYKSRLLGPRAPRRLCVIQLPRTGYRCDAYFAIRLAGEHLHTLPPYKRFLCVAPLGLLPLLDVTVSGGRTDTIPFGPLDTLSKTHLPSFLSFEQAS